MSDIIKRLAGLAKGVVDDHINSGSSLDDAITKVASAEDLSTNEIKRLVEASNTLTWLSVVKPSMDKTAEFKLASYPGVMANLHGSASPSESYSVDGNEYEIVEDPLLKVAEQTLPDMNYDTLDPLEKSASDQANHSHMCKSASLHLNTLEKSEFNLKCSLEEEKGNFGDAIVKLATNLSSTYAESFSEFEKKAYAILGPKSKQLLDIVYKNTALDKEASHRVTSQEAAQFSNMPFFQDDTNLELLKYASESLDKMRSIQQSLSEKSAEFKSKLEGYTRILSGGAS